jgi:hypothetical protein
VALRAALHRRAASGCPQRQRLVVLAHIRWLDKETTMLFKNPHTRQSLPAFTRLTLVALIVNAVAYSSEFPMIGRIEGGISSAVGGLLVASVLIATGWRWTPALGALLAGVITAGNPFLLEHLSHPDALGFFVVTVVEVVAGLVALVAGIAATIQNYRKGVLCDTD